MRHVITLIAAPDTVLEPLNFVTLLGQYDQCVWLEEGRAADFFTTQAPSSMLRSMLQQTAQQMRMDCIIQPVETRTKKLLIADMDSTMIDQECIDELADCMGLKAHVSAITERAMRGEIDFPDALRERVGLLKDLEEAALQTVFDKRITLMRGAKTLVGTMKARGAYCALVSGGFTFFTSRVAAALGFHLNEANRLVIAEGRLTGGVLEPILDKDSKRAALHRLARQKKLPLSATVAIGDGANDIPMLRDAGLGIAYHAKPAVVAATNAAIQHNDLSAVLFALGIRKKDWVGA